MGWYRHAVLLALGAVYGPAACSSLSGQPLGTGDHVLHDVDATSLPPQPTQDVPPDSPFAPVDGSSAYGMSDGYSPGVLTICASSGSDLADAAQEPDAAGSGAGTGSDGASTPCEPLPAACANEPDCVCLFRALAAEIQCPYPHCATDHGFKIYCP